MNDSLFKFKSPDFNKLRAFGFAFDGENYSYSTEIADGQFKMRVFITKTGEVKTEVIDLNTDEEYTLHLVEGACGSFVGAIRSEYERVLTDVAANCFNIDVFKSEVAHKVIAYVREKYGDELQYLWKKFPSNAVWRRKDNDKWYGVLLVLSKRKLGLDSDDEVTVIDLRVDPTVLPTIVDGKRYFPGYHMNKKSWLTMCLDGSVPFEELCDYIDKSYNLADKN